MLTDYRESHLGSDKGRSYADCFKENPHRSVVWRIEQDILNRIVRRFYRNRRFSLLDFACGTGRVLCHLEDRAESSTGIDVSPSMLDVARSNVRRSRIIEADITRVDVLQDQMFDLITAFRFFPNAEPPLRLEVMNALVKHMAPNGYLVFNNHKNSSSSVIRLAKLLGRNNAKDADMTTQEVMELVAEAGLRVVKRYHVGVLPVTEQHPILPRPMLYLLEQPMSWCGPLGLLARYHIYVCCRD